MRIQQLRFQNLNSLTGEWSIDFSAPAFLANGIFAITGPTGAGKTTILDAICLALYGRTPRLNRVNKNSNEIMSRQTGHCYAEISFITRDGHYRCHWSQQRARKKADGELQMPKHEISDVRSGQVLESKIRDVAVLVEEITGMNFAQFTRSMLLAQGGFAAFLQAPADERAPILEQITGTEIYSEISMRVHQRHREEKNRLDILEAEIAGIQVISEDEEESLREALEAKIEQENQQQQQLTVVIETLAWLDKLTGLEKEISTIEAQWQNYLERWEAFSDDGLRLERARQAMVLDGPYTKLAAIRSQQQSELAEITVLDEELPRQREVSVRANQLWHDAVHNLDKLKVLRKTEGETARKVREMDLLIKQHVLRIDEIQEAVSSAEKECADLQAKISSGQQEQKKMEEALRVIDSYLQDNGRDATLVTNLTGINRTFKRLQESAGISANKQQEYRQAIEVLQSLGKARAEIAAVHENNNKAQELQQKKLQDLNTRLENALQGHEINWWRDALDKFKEQKNRLEEMEKGLARIQQIEADLQASRESVKELGEQLQQISAEIARYQEKTDNCEREISHLEKQTALLSRIRDLEEERARLEDGSPCPLCGATEHPFAKGNVPLMGETELALNQAREMFKKLSQGLHARQLHKAQVDKELEHSSSGLQTARNLLVKEKKLRNEIIKELQPVFAGIKSLKSVQDLLSQIGNNINEYEQQIKHIEALQNSAGELSRQYEDYRREFIQSDKELQQAIAQQEQAQKEQERLQKECAAALAEVNNIKQEAQLDVAEYGISDLPLENLSCILQALDERKMQWEAQQAEKNRLQMAVNSIQTDLAQLLVRLQTRENARQNDCSRLEEQQELYRKQAKARFEIYAKRNPDVEEARLDEELNAADSMVEKARRDMEMARRNQEKLEERQQMLTDLTRDRALELQDKEHAFVRRLQQAGFTNEEEYRLAILSMEEQQSLSARAEKLKEEKTELQTRLLDRQDNLRREKDRKLTEQSREVLEEKRRLAAEELKEIRDDIGADKHRLQNSTAARRQMQQQLLKVEQQKEKMRRWDILHSLIGSTDGKKYRNFAQGLTFDIMIGHANRQLQKMSDRYLLLRNPLQALELNVIDHYQAGEIRSTANLSGGESFLVSLALALGLSRMASRKVSVDSLFLDEGFGALDEDTLDTALNTLAGLQQDGKLIGVISHVPALKERISTQIQVISQSGGRSILTGPGCMQIKL